MTTWNTTTYAGIALIAGGLAILVILWQVLRGSRARRSVSVDTVEQRAVTAAPRITRSAPAIPPAAVRQATMRPAAIGPAPVRSPIVPLVQAVAVQPEPVADAASAVPVPRRSLRTRRRRSLAGASTGGSYGYDDDPADSQSSGLASLGLADEDLADEDLAAGDLADDDRVNDDRVNDDRVNDDRVNDDRVNDDRVNDDRVNDDRVDDDWVGGDRVDGGRDGVLQAHARAGDDDEFEVDGAADAFEPIGFEAAGFDPQELAAAESEVASFAAAQPDSTPDDDDAEFRAAEMRIAELKAGARSAPATKAAARRAEARRVEARRVEASRLQAAETRRIQVHRTEDSPTQERQTAQRFAEHRLVEDRAADHRPGDERPAEERQAEERAAEARAVQAMKAAVLKASRLTPTGLESAAPVLPQASVLPLAPGLPPAPVLPTAPVVPVIAGSADVDRVEFEPALHDFAHLGSVGTAVPEASAADCDTKVLTPPARPAGVDVTGLVGRVAPDSAPLVAPVSPAPVPAARPTRYPFGDRVDGWVRPEYRRRAAEPARPGEYWTPVNDPYGVSADDRGGYDYQDPSVGYQPPDRPAPDRAVGDLPPMRADVAPMVAPVPPPPFDAAAAFEAARVRVDPDDVRYAPPADLYEAGYNDTAYRNDRIDNLQPQDGLDRDPYAQSPYDREPYDRARYDRARADRDRSGESLPWPPAPPKDHLDAPRTWSDAEPADESGAAPGSPQGAQRTEWARRGERRGDPVADGEPDAERSGQHFPRRRRSVATRRTPGRNEIVPPVEQPVRTRVTHPRAEARRQLAAPTELFPAVTEATQMLPSVPLADAETVGRPRPRPRPRTGGSQPGEDRPSRSTVYVSRHAAEPSTPGGGETG